MSTYERLTRSALRSIDPAHCETDAYVAIKDDGSIRIITPERGPDVPRQELVMPSISRNIRSVAKQLEWAVAEVERRNSEPDWEEEP